MNLITQNFNSSEIKELKRFGERLNKFGVNFTVCNSMGEILLSFEAGKFNSDNEKLIKCAQSILEQNQNSSSEADYIQWIGKQNKLLAGILKSGSGKAMAVGVIEPGDVQGRDEFLYEMFLLFLDEFQSITRAEKETETVCTELAQSYEELVLLHKLSTNMSVTESDSSYLQMACDNLTDIVSVEGIAMLLEKTVEEQTQYALTAGSGVIDIDERISATLWQRLIMEIDKGKEALLDSQVDSDFKYEWGQNIKNIVAVPLLAKNKTGTKLAEGDRNSHRMIGLMVAVNRIDKQDFDSTDMKLFNSVANSCAVFIENGRLFNDLQELFIGSLKALTNAIDAKDPYTRGHSERVAFISRWIAEKLAEENLLDEKQIQKVYLSGLLHDIGKMGVDESILRKKDKLTQEEFERIKAHPLIGANILGQIKQMHDILPGIRCHHERIDGRGYPNKLTGEQIPLIGKIVCIADSFDAMTSKRVYRDALKLEDAIAAIEKELGTQFDEVVGRTFLDSDVYQLWEIIEEGGDKAYERTDFSQYNNVNVGTLIK